MKKSVLLTVASLLVLGTATPSRAADGAMGSAASLAGATAATIVAVPSAILVDSLWRMPMATWHSLAGHFGDEHGLEQNVVGAALGIPWGIVWGIPTGAIRGAKHGMSVGWEKPFSAESFMVFEADKD